MSAGSFSVAGFLTGDFSVDFLAADGQLHTTGSGLTTDFEQAVAIKMIPINNIIFFMLE